MQLLPVPHHLIPPPQIPRLPDRYTIVPYYTCTMCAYTIQYMYIQCHEVTVVYVQYHSLIYCGAYSFSLSLSVFVIVYYQIWTLLKLENALIVCMCIYMYMYNVTWIEYMQCLIKESYCVIEHAFGPVRLYVCSWHVHVFIIV